MIGFFPTVARIWVLQFPTLAIQADCASAMPFATSDKYITQNIQIHKNTQIYKYRQQVTLTITNAHIVCIAALYFFKPSIKIDFNV